MVLVACLASRTLIPGAETQGQCVRMTVLVVLELWAHQDTIVGGPNATVLQALVQYGGFMATSQAPGKAQYSSHCT